MFNTIQAINSLNQLISHSPILLLHHPQIIRIILQLSILFINILHKIPHYLIITLLKQIIIMSVNEVQTRFNSLIINFALDVEFHIF